MTYPCCTSSALRILCCSGTPWWWRGCITRWAAAITVIMKEGVAHHPQQSYGRDADRGIWIERHMQPVRGEPAGVRRFNLHQDALLQPRQFLHLSEGGGYLRDRSRTGIRSFLRSL